MPILLTNSSLPDVTKQTLIALQVKNVFIVGGTGVISTSIEDVLKAMNITVTRIAGQDRYETAVKVAEQLGSPSEIFVATGEDYPDALSVGSIAAIRQEPIILVSQDNLPDSVKGYLSKNSITKSFVVGDTDIISDSVFNQLPGSERILGSDLYARNIAINQKFNSNFSTEGVCVATGENFADSLSGSAYASKLSEPIILVNNSTPDSIKSFYKQRLDLCNNPVITVFGGKSVVSDNVFNRNIIDEGILVSDFEDLSQWSVSSKGTMTADTVNFTSGTQGMKLTVTTPGSYVIAEKEINIDELDSVSFGAYVENWSTLSSIQFQITSVSDFSKKFGFGIYNSRIAAGWNNFKRVANDFTAYKNDSWGKMVKVRFIVGATSGNTTSVTFDNLRFNVKTKAKAILSFDGAYSSVYTTALPILNKYGFKGNLDILPSFLQAGDAGDKTRITTVQALELQNKYGWAICGHGISNTKFTELTDQQIIDEVKQCGDFLISKGLTSGCNHMTYPKGGVNQHVANVVASTGLIKTARGSHIYNEVQEQPVQPSPANEMLMLNDNITFQLSTKFETDVKPLIDKAVAHGGIFYPYMHGVETSGSANDITTTEFTLMIDYLAGLSSKGLIDVVTITDWYNESN